MVLIPGTNVGAPVVPYDTADLYPSHLALYGKGGWRTVPTTADRNAIPLPRLERGMAVTVQADAITYRLRETWPGVSAPVDADWEVIMGPGPGITGSGSPDSIALWTSSTALGANIFFIRSNSTSIVSNNQGFSSDYDVDVERFIDPAGSNSNSGTSSGPSNAWLTPAYAIAQCQQLGPGRYIIHCAPGTYSSVSFDVPNILSRGLDSSSLLSIIQFEGDQGAPATVIFENTSGTMIYAAATTTTLRLHGLTLQGNTSNNRTAINQISGKIIIRNCNFNNYFTGINGSGFSEVKIEAPVSFTETYFAFSGQGLFVNAVSQITHTSPSPSLQPPTTFSIINGSLMFGLGQTYSLTCPVGAQIGQLIYGRGTFINFGQLNTFQSNDAECLYDIDSCPNTEGNGNVYMANEALSYCKIKNCAIYNSPASQWWATAFAPEGVKLYDQGIFYSDIVLALGTPPIGSLQDYMTSYVQYQVSPTYKTFGLDNRYTEKYTFTTPGELPQGYSGTNLTPQGVSSSPYYIYIAEQYSEIIGIRVFTGTPNGAAHTDTYTVAINGTPSALTATLTNTDTGNNTGAIPMTTGQRASIIFTSDIATEAENITVQILVRIGRY